MNRFHQRLHENLRDPEFAEAFYVMSADIALLRVLAEARKALTIRPCSYLKLRKISFRGGFADSR